jgi:hypothetical protein
MEMICKQRQTESVKSDALHTERLQIMNISLQESLVHQYVFNNAEHIKAEISWQTFD